MPKATSPSIEIPREDIPHHGQRTTYRATHHQPPTSPTEQLMVGASPATQQLLCTSTRPKKCQAATRVSYTIKQTERKSKGKDLRSKNKQAY